MTQARFNSITGGRSYDDLEGWEQLYFANLYEGEDYIWQNRADFQTDTHCFDSEATLPNGDGDLRGYGGSNHGMGKALDFNFTEGSDEYQWLYGNRSTYGFERDSTEYWHFNYVG